MITKSIVQLESSKKGECFAKWLAGELQRSAKTQQEIAEECGLSRSYITMLKTKGAHRLPSPGTLFLLVRSLGADINKAFESAGLDIPENLRRAVESQLSEPHVYDKIKCEITALKKQGV